MDFCVLQETAARTIRTKIHRHLNEFLTEFIPIVAHHKIKSESPKLTFEINPSDPKILSYFPEVNSSPHVLTFDKYN